MESVFAWNQKLGTDQKNRSPLSSLETRDEIGASLSSLSAGNCVRSFRTLFAIGCLSLSSVAFADDVVESRQTALQSQIQAGKEDIAISGALAPSFRLRSLAVSNLAVGNGAVGNGAAPKNPEFVTLGDFAGKYLLINFWATWCATCAFEMPSLERVGKLLPSERFKVLSINVDDSGSDAQVRRYIERHGLTFEVLRDPEAKTPLAYGLTGYPETFLISPEGRFMALVDPTTGKPTVRFVSDRPWDSAEFVKTFSALISIHKVGQ